MALEAQGTDIVLVINDLRRVPTAIRLNRRCRSTLSVNVAGPLP
jgi:Zn2+/Cd2+-exporting ATPase